MLLYSRVCTGSTGYTVIQNTVSFGQGGTNARRCEGKEVVLEETRL